MKKGFVLFFSLLVFGLMISGTVWRSANSFAQNPFNPLDDGGSEMWKSDLIDEKALQAKDNEESAVRALVDEVFSVPKFAIIPTVDREAIKERVLNAELAYRSGQSEGIPEENIVQTVNELADKLAAPDFAKTSTLQVRVLRAGLMNDYPNFIAQEITEIGVTPAGGGEPSWEVAIGDSVSSTMSPLESVYVTALMLEQKILNESYQYTPQEWVDEVYNKQLAQWQADMAGESGNEQSNAPVGYFLGAITPENDEKRNQMMQSITAGAASLLSSESLNSSDSTNLYDTTLDTLGIQR